MNNTQKEIIRELKNISKKIGHSPRKREVPKLASKCYQHFRSFNLAKKTAGLEIVNVRISSFPQNAFKLDKDLVTIIAYLTADGHLYKDLKGFYFCSKDKKSLKKLSNIIYNKFGLSGKYVSGTGHGESYKYLVFNKSVTLFLKNKGAPAGNKMFVPFDVPEWIKKNKEFVKEYLKIIFYCEGSKYKQSKNTERIKINFNKSKRLLKDGLKFMESLKDLLSGFEIETTNIWASESNKRKDGEMTNQINFQIKSKSNNTFINKIGWIK